MNNNVGILIVSLCVLSSAVSAESFGISLTTASMSTGYGGKSYCPGAQRDFPSRPYPNRPYRYVRVYGVTDYFYEETFKIPDLELVK